MSFLMCRRAVAAMCAALIILAFGVAPAVASPADGPRLPGVRNGSSTNWSGYAVQTSLTAPANGAVTEVHGHWYVPTVTSTASVAYSAAWVGIDGYSSRTVEQLGTSQDWSNGAARYYAWWEMYPKRPYLISGITVDPGDEMSATVSYLGNGRFSLAMDDVTDGTSFSTIQKQMKAKRSSAEWVLESQGTRSVLPNFGTASFFDCRATLNGVSGPISAWAYDPISLVNLSGETLAYPSALTSGGTAFTMTWVKGR